MSRQLIDHNPDLRRLWEEGYDIEIRSGHLLVKYIPYLNATGEVRHGTFVTPLGEFSGDHLQPPADHTIYFSGDCPCDESGSKITEVNHCGGPATLADGIQVQHRFSAKPRSNGGRYVDYHQKVVTYESYVSGPAAKVDPSLSARRCAVVVPEPDESPFHYRDTASTRVGITAISEKLMHQRLAIVGVGGTGSYVLDFVSKTPVSEIHVFDGDEFMNHNAFRAPGAASLNELRARPSKVRHLCDQYARMHRGIRPHEYYVTEKNVEELRGLDFVFICVDRGHHRKMVVEQLRSWGQAFIDVGMGVAEVGGKLRGQLRVTSCTPTKSDHVGMRIPFSGGLEENDYSSNIQIAELNSLNASLAVIKWKKLCGFYLDQEKEHHCIYAIDGNVMANEDVE